MGSLIRNYDWSQSLLGPLHTWPSGLKTNLSNVLHSGFPMLLFWGADCVCFYNDAYKPGLNGKHPAIGKYAKEIWLEDWNDIGKLISGVYISGRSHLNEDQLLHIDRDGRQEEVYWTYRYTPAYDDHGTIAGVLVTCLDTTLAVMAQKRIEAEVEERFRELKTANERVTQANKYLQDIINSFKQPLQVLQPVVENGIIVDFRFKLTNAAYAAYANTTPQFIQNKKVSDVFPGYLSTTSFSNVKKTFESGVADTWEIHYDQDGLDLHNEMTAIKMGDDVILHFADFTRLKHLEFERLRKIADLELSNKNLESFAHVVSHDLKEPIRKIRLFTSRLKDDLQGQLKEFNPEPLNKIDLAAKRMAVFIDDLLLYSTFHQLPPETELVNLEEVLQRVLDDLDVLIQETKAKITVKNLPVVNGHSSQLQQLFQNLISNALKYVAPHVTPRIAISCQQQIENEKSYHLIRVKDNGIGFEQKFADEIFHLFTRLHGKSRYSGSGIGLSIVKKIVDNHHGSIRAESIPGQGSTFNVLIPVE